jgi:hypothetical protein
VRTPVWGDPIRAGVEVGKRRPGGVTRLGGVGKMAGDGRTVGLEAAGRIGAGGGLGAPIVRGVGDVAATGFAAAGEAAAGGVATVATGVGANAGVALERPGMTLSNAGRTMASSRPAVRPTSRTSTATAARTGPQRRRLTGWVKTPSARSL